MRRNQSQLRIDLLAALAVLGLLLAPHVLRAQGAIGMSPMRLELKMAPGAPYSGTLNVTNDGDARQRVRGEVLDFFVDAQATPQFEPSIPSEAAYSCRSWLTLNPVESEIAPQSALRVRYSLRVPPEVAEGSYACAGGYTTLPTAMQMTGMGLRAAVRVVATFYVVIGNPKIDGSVKEIKLERVPGGAGGWQAVLVLENRGAMYFRPTGKLDLLDPAGKVVESQELATRPVLPHREQRFPFLLKTQLEGGSYTLRARVDLGTNEIQEATAVVGAPQKQ